MKRKLLIVLGLVVLIALVTQTVSDYIQNVNNEHRWYLSQLNFEFSGEIDTVKNRHIAFHVTHGPLNPEREALVNTWLTYNGFAYLFAYRDNNRIELMIDSAFRYQRGDSVYLNTTINQIRIYRNHKILAERSLLKSIRAKPFKDIF